MQRTEAQHSHAQKRSDARQGKGAVVESPQSERIAQLEAMVENSTQAAKQVQFTAMAHASPAVIAQRKLAGTIHGSPSMVSQRKVIDGIHASPRVAAQRQEREELETKPEAAQRTEAPIKPNHTGLPENLKSGVESLSGLSMDNVRVHYNSSQPAQLNALAYAQGTDIHVAPGQEQHLPHEAWHVVQQAQGRVKPTMQMTGGTPVNDDSGLEREADVMGERAMRTATSKTKQFFSGDRLSYAVPRSKGPAIQRHVLLGAMIKGQDNPAPINPGAWKDFDYSHVFDVGSHRGDLASAETGGTFDWGGGALAGKVKEIRNESGFEDDDPNFIVVANVNTYKTPGIDDIPAPYAQTHLYAFGNGWSLKYNLSPFAKKANYSGDYNAVLASWQKLPTDPGQKLSEENKALGSEGAKQVLRHLTKKYWQANKNFVIPHRGLRNNVLGKIAGQGIVEKLQGKLQEKEDSSVSILHLDDDLKVGDQDLVKNMMTRGEQQSREEVGKSNPVKRGVAFSAPGYIYEMENNLLEYAASVLSHIAGRVVKGSYPSEPGLMVTYDNTQKKSVWKDFLLKSPWGEENPDLKKLKPYGSKQQKARVESKEGRAFASQYSDYLISRGAPKSGAASYKMPIRGKEFVSVAMSSVVKDEIVGKPNPQDVKALLESDVLNWITTYITRNRYHPAGGGSESAKKFREEVLPVAAKIVKKVIDENKGLEESQSAIRQALEELDTSLQDKESEEIEAVDEQESGLLSGKEFQKPSYERPEIYSETGQIMGAIFELVNKIDRVRSEEEKCFWESPDDLIKQLELGLVLVDKTPPLELLNWDMLELFGPNSIAHPNQNPSVIEMAPSFAKVSIGSTLRWLRENG